MLKFCIKRILWMIPILLAVVIIVFTICHFMPGDPVEVALSGQITSQEQYDATAAKLGTDQPFLVQLWNYIKNLITRFDMGVSYQTGRSVSEEIGDRVWTSLKIGLLSCCLCVVLGITLGVLSAVKQNSLLDYIVTTLSVLLAAVPGFWLALMLMLLFCLKLRLLPASGLETWTAYILPVVCNATLSLAITTRMTRSSMLEVIRQDYVRTARAKGLPERVVIVRHALKNALIPVITVIGTQFSMIIGGSVIVENIFGIAGMGSRLVQAINGRDYSVVLSITVIISAFTMLVVLVVDLVYALVDPRIRAQFASPKRRKKAAAAKEVRAS